MTLLEHAGWLVAILIAIVVAVALNACGNDYKCCGKNHLWRDQAIRIMDHRCAEHRRVWSWHDKNIDVYTGVIEWTCGDGSVGSQEYDS